LGRLEKALLKHSKVGIDTSIFIYHLESHQSYLPLTTLLLRLITEGRLAGVTSEITIMELLVKPLEEDNQDIADEYEVLLDNFPNLKIKEVGRSVSRKAAELRVRHSVNPADALQIAAAIAEKATAFITNDRQLKQVADVEIVILSEFLSQK